MELPTPWVIRTVADRYRDRAGHLGRIDYPSVERLKELNATVCWIGTGPCAGWLALGRNGCARVALCRPLKGKSSYVISACPTDLMLDGEGAIDFAGVGRSGAIARGNGWIERLRGALRWDLEPLPPMNTTLARDPSAMRYKHLPFELLPPGRWDIRTVIEHYRRLAARGGRWRRVDEDRMKQIYSLNPVVCWVGKEGWEGYVVFGFAGCERVILDCPLVGNAAYVLSGDWKQAIRLSKAEVRLRIHGDYTKVVHKGEWLDRLRAALRPPRFR